MSTLPYISANKVLFWIASFSHKGWVVVNLIKDIWKDSPEKVKEYSVSLNKNLVRYGGVEGMLMFYTSLPGEDREKLLTFVFSNYFLEDPLEEV